MLSPGPSNNIYILGSCFFSPSALPISSPSSGSQLFAIAAAVGKQVAFKEAFKPRLIP